ncbi:MAG: hypothetical protein ACNA7Y_00210 [Gammaproteobacteria bacterium]
MKITIELDPEFTKGRINHIDTVMELTEMFKSLPIFKDMTKVSFDDKGDVMTIEPNKKPS